MHTQIVFAACTRLMRCVVCVRLPFVFVVVDGGLLLLVLQKLIEAGRFVRVLLLLWFRYQLKVARFQYYYNSFSLP